MQDGSQSILTCNNYKVTVNNKPQTVYASAVSRSPCLAKHIHVDKFLGSHGLKKRSTELSPVSQVATLTTERHSIEYS